MPQKLASELFYTVDYTIDMVDARVQRLQSCSGHCEPIAANVAHRNCYQAHRPHCGMFKLPADIALVGTYPRPIAASQDGCVNLLTQR